MTDTLNNPAVYDGWETPYLHLCGALKGLRVSVDTWAPRRSHVTDGTIGDARHRAEGGASDHNPHPYNGSEWVAAMDITNDVAMGCSGRWLAKSLQLARDPRIKYVIWDRQIMQSLGHAPWTWTAYTGTDPHVSHVHVSVLLNADTTLPRGAWALPIFHAFNVRPTLQMGSQGYDVMALQGMLNVIPDGVFGPLTDRAVRVYQVQTSLTVDGIVGPITWSTLRHTF
jgi:peptidoglycan hydrolase-like protein with peptidoglycan-binding domain